MNYQETMDYITNTAKFGSNLGLSRTEKILEILGDPHKKVKAVHISGTNGKGSVTAMVNEILKKSGLKVGMYTSPYLEDFEERIQINGVKIPKEDLSEVVTEVSKAVNKVIELGYDHPTEFEIITCTMFYYFYKSKVDIAVIEVGLGGRLDSTNVMEPYNKDADGGVLVSTIVSISHDHMNILGDTLPKIAYEKCGIIKKGVPVVMYPQQKEAEEVIEKVCKDKGCNLIKVSKDFVKFDETENKKINKCSSAYTQKFKLNTYKDEYLIDLGLLGKHQLLNCATAVSIIEQLQRFGLNISEEHIINGLKDVKWIGRLEVMKNKPLVVIDGAHNIDGIKKLNENVNTYFEYNNMILILGILADKEVEKMVEIIVPKAAKVIAVTPNSERAENAQELKKVIEKYSANCIAVEKYDEAFKEALKLCKEDDLLLISGSLYMIGDMRKIITNIKS